jgi:hypothetical protein
MKTTATSRAHAIAATLLLGGAVLYLFPPAEHSFYPRCIFHALTGLQCPGCGGTRALHELLHFHVAAAWGYNAMITVLAPLAFAWFVAWYRSMVWGPRMPVFRFPRAAMVGAYFVVLLFGIARNVAFHF